MYGFYFTFIAMLIGFGALISIPGWWSDKIDFNMFCNRFRMAFRILGLGLLASGLFLLITFYFPLPQTIHSYAEKLRERLGVPLKIEEFGVLDEIRVVGTNEIDEYVTVEPKYASMGEFKPALLKSSCKKMEEIFRRGWKSKIIFRSQSGKELDSMSFSLEECKQIGYGGSN